MFIDESGDIIDYGNVCNEKSYNISINSLLNPIYTTKYYKHIRKSTSLSCDFMHKYIIVIYYRDNLDLTITLHAGKLEICDDLCGRIKIMQN